MNLYEIDMDIDIVSMLVINKRKKIRNIDMNTDDVSMFK